MNMANVKGPSHLINRDTATSEGLLSPAIENDNWMNTCWCNLKVVLILIKFNNFIKQKSKKLNQIIVQFNHSNLNDGLVAWEKLLTDFSDRTKEETDYIKLGIAKMLMKLNKPDDALNLLSSVQTKSLLHSKGILTQKIRLLRNKWVFWKFNNEIYYAVNFLKEFYTNKTFPNHIKKISLEIFDKFEFIKTKVIMKASGASTLKSFNLIR